MAVSPISPPPPLPRAVQKVSALLLRHRFILAYPLGLRELTHLARDCVAPSGACYYAPTCLHPRKVSHSQSPKFTLAFSPKHRYLHPSFLVSPPSPCFSFTSKFPNLPSWLSPPPPSPELPVGFSSSSSLRPLFGAAGQLPSSQRHQVKRPSSAPRPLSSPKATGVRRRGPFRRLRLKRATCRPFKLPSGRVSSGSGPPLRHRSRPVTSLLATSLLVSLSRSRSS